MQEKINNVYRTTDYQMFRVLSGNRSVTKARVKHIKDSINKVGYVQSPIIINEKNEVIDGQGRLAALQDLNLPVDYIVVKGIGIEECRAMNINQSNWSLKDWIVSYADEGNPNYQYFKCLYDKYKNLGLVVIYNAVHGLSTCGNDVIKSGALKCTPEQYDKASKDLEYLTRFKGIVAEITGRIDYIYIAIRFASNMEGVDRERLFRRLSEERRNFAPPANLEQALKEISRIYNFRFKGQRHFFEYEYKQMCDSSYVWYAKRYGSQSRSRHVSSHRDELWEREE